MCCFFFVSASSLNNPWGFTILLQLAVGNILIASILPLDTAHISKSVSVGRMEVRHHSADRYGAVTPPLIKRRHSDSFSEVRPRYSPPTQMAAAGGQPDQDLWCWSHPKDGEKKRHRLTLSPSGGDEAIWSGGCHLKCVMSLSGSRHQ